MSPGLPGAVQDAALRLVERVHLAPGGRTGWFAGPLPGADGWGVVMAATCVPGEGGGRSHWERSFLLAPRAELPDAPLLAWGELVGAATVAQVGAESFPESFPLADAWWALAAGNPVVLPVEAGPELAAVLLRLAPPGSARGGGVALGLGGETVPEGVLIASGPVLRGAPPPAPIRARAWFQAHLDPLARTRRLDELDAFWAAVTVDTGPATGLTSLGVVIEADCLADAVLAGDAVELDRVAYLEDPRFVERLASRLLAAPPGELEGLACRLACPQRKAPGVASVWPTEGGGACLSVAAVLAWEGALRAGGLLPEVARFGPPGAALGCRVLAGLGRGGALPALDRALDVQIPDPDVSVMRTVSRWIGRPEVMPTRREVLGRRARRARGARPERLPRAARALRAAIGSETRHAPACWSAERIGGWLDDLQGLVDDGWSAGAAVALLLSR